MKNEHFCRVALIAIAGMLLFSGSASAQAKFDRKEFLKKFLDASNKIPEKQKKLLSAGMQNFLAFAALMTSPHTKGEIGVTVAKGRRSRAAQEISALGPGGTTRVSNPNLDFVDELFAGFSQNETSSARCGNNIVVGFNDSGAILRTSFTDPAAAISGNGVAVSASGGKSFIDLGFLNPGGDPANFLMGDPAVACTSSSRFYYSSIFGTATPPDPNGNRHPVAAVGVNTSFSGGANWNPPVAAVTKNGSLHFLDKPWIAADPTNPARLYVSYTDFDDSRTSAACPDDFRMAIEVVTTANGGNTWSAPGIVDQVCGASLNTETGSNIVVSPSGKLYVAFEFIPASLISEIRFSTSSDSATTFSTPIPVTTGVGQSGVQDLLQGDFRTNEFPQIAVDRSGNPSAGNIYVVWQDGRDNIIPDVIFGTYAFPDVLISKSTDGGHTFSAPEAVSPTPAGFEGIGRDQFFPGVAVDKDGEVGVCYYDRRSNPENTAIDRFCSVSHNQGATWVEQRVSESNWVPLHDADVLVNSLYIGDYDALTSDFLLQNDGFFGTFEIMENGNPNVFAKKF